VRRGEGGATVVLLVDEVVVAFHGDGLLERVGLGHVRRHADLGPSGRDKRLVLFDDVGFRRVGMRSQLLLDRFDLVGLGDLLRVGTPALRHGTRIARVVAPAARVGKDTGMKGDRVEVVVDVGGGDTRTYEIVALRAGRRVETTTGRGVVEVAEVTRTGVIVRTARFMQTRVIAVVEHPADDGVVEGEDGPSGRRRVEPPDDQESLYL
jgi:hypothetical protein